MKLILEKSNDSYYAYTEDEDHFKVVQENKDGGRKNFRRLEIKELQECNLDTMKNNSYFVFDLAEPLRQVEPNNKKVNNDKLMSIANRFYRRSKSAEWSLEQIGKLCKVNVNIDNGPCSLAMLIDDYICGLMAERDHYKAKAEKCH